MVQLKKTHRRTIKHFTVLIEEHVLDMQENNSLKLPQMSN